MRGSVQIQVLRGAPVAAKLEAEVGVEGVPMVFDLTRRGAVMGNL